ncbi:Uncharacterised protein [Chlamydia trachomatis]|nr:Uncharacterised protein [Chlamydia trachomatis]
MLFNVNRSEQIFALATLAQNHGVFVVVAIPCHKCHEQILPKSQFTACRCRPISNQRAFFDAVAFIDAHMLVCAVTLVGTLKLEQLINTVLATIFEHMHCIGRNFSDDARSCCYSRIASINGCACLHAGAHKRSYWAQQGHGLPLHVCTHKSTVRIVMLQERNHSGTHRAHLACRNVHIAYITWMNERRLTARQAHKHLFFSEIAILVDRGISLSNVKAILIRSVEVVNLICDAPVDNLAVWSLNKSVGIYTSIACKGANQTDVWTFRSFDRAHTPIV